jgi:hypothetical protein
LLQTYLSASLLRKFRHGIGAPISIVTFTKAILSCECAEWPITIKYMLEIKLYSPGSDGGDDDKNDLFELGHVLLCESEVSRTIIFILPAKALQVRMSHPFLRFVP